MSYIAQSKNAQTVSPEVYTVHTPKLYSADLQETTFFLAIKVKACTLCQPMVDLASRKRGSWRSRAAIIDAMEKGKCCTPLCPGIVLAFVPNMSIKLLLYCRPEWYVKWYPQCCIC